jgi:hypothetical protein
VLNAIFTQNNGMQAHNTDLTIEMTIHQQAAEKVMAKRVVKARVMRRVPKTGRRRDCD